MKRPNPCWYFVALGFALVLPGVRALSWKSPQATPLDAAAVEAGKTLFTHEWKPRDPLANGGDGLGPVFNAASCVACHGQPSVGGASGREFNVTLFTIAATTIGGQSRTGLVHARAVAPKYQESLDQVDPSLPQLQRPVLVPLGNSNNGRPSWGFNFDVPTTVILSQRNTPALYGAKWIDEIPDRVILAQEKSESLHWGLAPASSNDLPVGRALRLPDGRVGKFGWKAQSSSLLEFVQAACANELGLSNPAQAQPKPISRPNYPATGFDLTRDQCQQMTTYIAALARPMERMPADAAARATAEAGKKHFSAIGCADCHTPSLGSIDGIYSDLLLHRMGFDLQGGGFYYGDPIPASSRSFSPAADEWRTAPLWGIADTGPYMHDGRADTLEEAIRMHGGQGLRSATAFARLTAREQAELIGFLKTLRTP